MMMKTSRFNKIIVASLLFVFVGCPITKLHAQEWRKALPQEKLQQHDLTLKDYQKAFYTHLKQENLKEANAINENEVKDENYEKFKRWEWFWESRVNPKTGAFPVASSYAVQKAYQTAHAKEFELSAGNWISVGPKTSKGGYAGLGRINCVAYSPADTNILYVGSASGGAWKTTNGGSTWSPLGDFNNALGVADMVVVNQGGDDIVYLGTGDKDHWDTYSIGVLKSTDGGLSWKTTGLNWQPNQYGMVYRLLLDPGDNNTLYAATNKGLFKTTDAGISWQIINSQHFRDIEFQPGSNSRMYAASSQDGAIYYSVNSGLSWIKSIANSDDKRTELAVTPDSANVVYAVMAAKDDGLLGVYRSSDSGKTYVIIPDTLNLLGWHCDGADSGGQGWYDLTIAADPHHANKIFVGGVNNWMSNDGGKTWIMSNHWSSSCSGKNDIVHADKHYLSFQPGTNTLFECNDGGIYKTKDGKSWDYIGSGLITSQIYRLGTSKTVSGEVITGLQDNGTKLFSSGSWYNVGGGDGMECLIDYTDFKTQYCETPNGSISRTKDHWNSSSDITTGLTGKGAWVTPFIIDPIDHKTLYIGYQDVFKSTNQGDNWTKISSWNDKALRSLAIAPSNNKVLYAATYDILYQTKDGGAHWTDITGSLPVNSASITYIAVKNNNPNTLWITMSGYNGDGVYESVNGGISWDNVSTGLPDIPINCIVQNTLKTDTTELYVGTDVGVYVRQNYSQWVPFTAHLPNVVVDELEIQYDSLGSGKIYAATYGRGLWKSQLFQGKLENIKQANFEADITVPTVIDTVRFTDISNISPTSWKWVFSPNTVSYLSGTDSSSQNPMLRFDKAGRYNVSLTASDATTSYTKLKVQYIEAQDILTVKLRANRTTVCSGDTTQLFADVSGGSGIYYFNWTSSPAGFTTTSQNPVVTPVNDTTQYQVKVIDGQQTISDSITIFKEECPSGISDHPALFGKVSIFPNPNSGSFTIEAEKNVYKVEIVNTQGMLIFSKIYNDKKAVVFSRLAKGIYFVKIAIGSQDRVKGYVNRKIIVE